jgi:glycosyltransferase involved in cell wall biosynthesis
MTLRLALVTETFPPEVNGVARTLGRWVEAFRERGHEVLVLRPKQADERSRPELVQALPLPFYSKLRFGVTSPWRMRGLLQRYQPDLIHIATEGPLGWAVLFASQMLRLPVVSSFHTNFDQYLSHYGLGLLSWAAGAYLRWFHNQTLATFVPSEGTRRRLEREGMQRVEIWSRGVDARAFDPRFRNHALRAEHGLTDGDVLLTYVGRLAVEKNLPALLSAFTRLREHLPAEQAARVRLALVGDGPLYPQLERARIPGVILAGERHGQDLARWYASGDVFVFPSQSETFGNVILEAQASGLPVIGFDCQAVNERITPEADGLLVPVDGDLAPAMARLCREESLRRAMADASRHKAEAQTWPAIFDALERRYHTLVEEARRPATPTFSWANLLWGASAPSQPTRTPMM